MSDLSDLHGVFPPSLRWNAEASFLAISVFNSESGERELQEIELGKSATFALDLATGERGYGLIKTGVYDMRLTPVGAPPPPWPGDEEFKPAIGCWLWNPTLGEVRLETNAKIFREAVANVWNKARFEPQAAEGLQPVVCFVDRVAVPVKAVNKTFSGPVIKVIGWVERDKVPGWREREPTVAPPAALPVLSAPEPAATPVDGRPRGRTTITSGRKADGSGAAVRRAAARPDPASDSKPDLDDTLEDLPW
jgi:hypothetical protein